MKKGSTLVLKTAVVIMGLIVLALAIFALPNIYKGGSMEYPETSRALLVIIGGLYVSVVPFFAALWQTLKLITYIDENLAFSDLSVNALRNIKRAGIIIGLIYLVCLPFVLPIAEADDAPGILVMWFAFALIPLVVAVFAAVLQKLLKSAIEMKSENELTV